MTARVCTLKGLRHLSESLVFNTFSSSSILSIHFRHSGSSSAMWTLRRVCNPLRNQGVRIGTLCSFSKLETPNAFLGEKLCVLDYSSSISDRSLFLKRLYHIKCFPSMPYGRSLSSQPGANSSGDEDDLEDGFSELEIQQGDESKRPRNAGDASEDDLISASELSDDDIDVSEEPAHNELDLLETETDVTEKPTSRKWQTSELFKAITQSPGLPVHNVLDKWVKDGKDLIRAEISLAMLNLRKRRMFGRALQLSEWLEANKQLDFVERDYASRVDLICKVRGLFNAENYIEKIPQSFRGEIIYRTLLANCAVANNVKKAEEVFNKMKDMEFPVTAFSCNQLLILYKRHDKKKIADVLLLMEKENVKPSLFTYKILIDTKGLSNDMTGMEQVVETMKAEGIEPDINTQAILARHYTAGGLKAKAETVLREIEGDDLKENRWVCRFLLPLYADLQMSDEVERVWKVCEENPRVDECLAGIVAWGKLKNIAEAEAIFDRMSKQWKKLSSRQYSVMLKVYADHKMLPKGKDLIKRMGNDGCKIGPLTWDALVKLYVEAGEVEKADSILQKAVQNNQMRPLYSSYMAIMDQYAKRGDVHNTEKTFHRMRLAGYVTRARQFQALLQSYINAKAPAYGIRERMKADNLFPNKAMAAQLAQTDAFRKSAVSDLLD